MSIMLKVKENSLAAEARIIRRLERRRNRCTNCAKWRRDHITEVQELQGPNAGQTKAFLVCEEGGLQFNGERPKSYNQLRNHRRFVVRVEARATHLARAFLKGQSYVQVEQDARRQPSWRAIDLMLSKYATMEQLAGGFYSLWKETAQRIIEEHRLEVGAATESKLEIKEREAGSLSEDKLQEMTDASR